MRRAVTMLVVVVVGAIVVPVAWPTPHDTGAALPTTYANPVIDDASADPFVLEWAQLAYAYVAGPSAGEIAVYASGDLATWEAVGDVLPDDHGGWWTGSVGSPAVAVYPDNPAGARFVLWFSATEARSGRRCIAVAAAATPTGPFHAADEPLLCPPGGARDPSPVPVAGGGGGGGPAQLVFRRDGDRPGIYAQRLQPDGRSPASTPPSPLLLDDATGQATRPSVLPAGPPEQALLLFSFTAAGNTTRSIGWARCTLDPLPNAPSGGPADATAPAAAPAPAGPADSAAATTASPGATGTGAGRRGGLLVTECTAVPGGQQWVVGNDAAASPGAPQVFGKGADRWIAYDAYEPGACATGTCSGPRRTHIDKLCLDDPPPAAPEAAAGAAATTDRATEGAAATTGTAEPPAATTGRARSGAEGAGGARVAPRTGAPSVGEQGLARERGCRDDVVAGWVATWGAGTMPASSQFAANAGGFADQTLRQMVHTSAGGEAVRVRLSNTYGTVPLHVGRATVGLASQPAGSSAAVQPASQRPLTFGGLASVVVPPGGDVVSDAVALEVPEDHDLAVSLWFPQPTGPPSGHLVALETSYIGAGDLVDDPGPGFADDDATATTTTSSFFVSAVDVLVDRPEGTVVLLGDSLTDGAGSVPDTEHRWSDLLVDRLAAGGPVRRGVVNVGIAGNLLLPGGGTTSPDALARLDHDVLAQADVDTVVVLLGTNDLLSHGAVGATVTDALEQVIARAHATGVRVVGATVPPLAGPEGPPTAAATEQARREVNARIRPGSAGSLDFDAVVDMDTALRDPVDPGRLRSEYAWFGGFHPNEAGHRAMAAAVDLARLVPGGQG